MPILVKTTLKTTRTLVAVGALALAASGCGGYAPVTIPPPVIVPSLVSPAEGAVFVGVPHTIPLTWTAGDPRFPYQVDVQIQGGDGTWAYIVPVSDSCYAMVGNRCEFVAIWVGTYRWRIASLGDSNRPFQAFAVVP
jgi:hypothetical protein